MLRFLFICHIILFNFLIIQAQDSLVIAGQLLGNTRYAVVELLRFEVGEISVAKASIDENKFRFALAKDFPKGVYRLRYSQTEPDRQVDIIIDGEPRIDFVLNLNDPAATPQFGASAQNKVWYDYQALTKLRLQKLELLNFFISQYPSQNDEIIKQTYTAFEKEKTEAKKAFEAFVGRYSQTYAGKMAQNKPLWFPNPKDDARLQDFYRKQQYWNGINTSDTSLLNTPLYGEHILNYLRYYMSPEMSMEEQVSGFKKSVDTIMQHFSGNERMKLFALNYLTLGFKEIGQEEVLQYLDENYRTTEQCESDQEKDAFAKRLAAYEALKPGQPAPEIEFASAKGNTLGLKDIEADTLIVVFWASWCPHCTEVVPQLNQAIAYHTNKKVLAISLDTDPTPYLQAAGKLGNMLHLCDYGKWDSKAVSAYHVLATPTFFVLDKARNIIGKYSNLEQLSVTIKI